VWFASQVRRLRAWVQTHQAQRNTQAVQRQAQRVDRHRARLQALLAVKMARQHEPALLAPFAFVAPPSVPFAFVAPPSVHAASAFVVPSPSVHDFAPSPSVHDFVPSPVMGGFVAPPSSVHDYVLSPLEGVAAPPPVHAGAVAPMRWNDRPLGATPGPDCDVRNSDYTEAHNRSYRTYMHPGPPNWTAATLDTPMAALETSASVLASRPPPPTGTWDIASMPLAVEVAGHETPY
jgi:hypothetical protein